MEYKSKKETREYKILFNEAYSYVRSIVTEYNYYYRLIGSAKRNLVLSKPNTGFDFDYQIIFYSDFSGTKSKDLIQIKKDFLDAFNNFFTEKGYKFAEDSRAAITIKKLDGDKIHHSYDITLLSPNKNNGLSIFRYSNPEKTVMTLNEMRKSIYFTEKYKQVKGSSMWSELRVKYKDKQERNNGDKKSFSLLLEAVNELID